MKPSLAQLERDVERRMRDFAEDMHVAAPAAAVRERVIAAVHADAPRLGWSRNPRLARVRSAGRMWSGVAAAALLALLVQLPNRPVSIDAVGTTELFASASSLDDWLSAAAETSDAVSVLYEAGWTVDAADPTGDAMSDDPLESLEKSFESIERVIGV